MLTNVSHLLSFHARLWRYVVATALTATASLWAQSAQAEVIRKEFVCDAPPFAECHASTVLPLKDGGLLVGYFGGTKEMHPDVGIWLSRYENGKWAAPVEVANGVLTPEESQNVPLPENAHSCVALYANRPITRVAAWNPVLFRLKNGDIALFYKLGTHPQTWWGMMMRSSDEGKTWSAPRRLPDGIYGPIKNKPVYLKDGTLLCPTSVENDDGWFVYFESSQDDGETWQKTATVSPGGAVDAIQPSVLFLPDGTLQAVGRTRPPKRGGFVFQTFSTDNGRTWSPLSSTGLPNNNSGTDAVTLQDGSHLLVYNHTAQAGRKHRSPLNVAWSPDGKTWTPVLTLEDAKGEYSYPAVVQAPDGTVHIVYTWNCKKIRHVALNPSKLRNSLHPVGVSPNGGAVNPHDLPSQ